MKKFLKTFVNAGLAVGVMAASTGCLQNVDPINDGIDNPIEQPDNGQDQPNDGNDGDNGQQDPNAGEQPNEPDPTENPAETPVETPAETPEKHPLVGVWDYQAGDLHKFFPYVYTHLELREDRVVVEYQHDAATNMILNVEGIYAPLIEGILSLQLFEPARLMFYAVDADALELSSSPDFATTFQRGEAVANELKYKKSATLQSVDLPFESYRGLGYDGTNLFFTEDDTNMEIPVDPDTLTAGAPVEITTRNATALQDGNLWHFTNRSRTIELKDPAGTVLDTVKTDELGHDLDIRCATFDPVERILWLHGESNVDDKYRFLKVDADAEPDVLLEAFEFDHRLEAIAWQTDSLWAVTDFPSRVVEIDTTSRMVSETYDVPALNVYWEGMQIIGTRIFISGSKYDGQSSYVIYEIEPNADEIGKPTSLVDGFFLD